MGRKTKNKLPSGSFRVQVLDYVDPETGKRHYQSFTADSKQEAKMMALEWKNTKKSLKEDITVYEACRNYIDIRSPHLSPSTITGYETSLKRIKKHKISGIHLKNIRNVDLQIFISELGTKDLSPKTISNTHGLISSAISLYMPEFPIRVSLPKKKKPLLYLPSTSDIQVLLNHCKTTELKLAVLFAAEGTMRRGEACAVKFKDCNFTDHTIRINKAYVKAENKYWEIHDPKTEESIRTIQMPGYIFDMIKSLKHNKEYVLNMNPDQLYDKFSIALNHSGLPHFRYHDLRHYAASEMHANGVPERYIENRGGWKPGSNVLKRTYENVIDLERKRQEEAITQLHKFSV